MSSQRNKKQRLDLLLVERGFVESRRKAQSLIMAHSVLIDDKPIVKSGALVDPECTIRLRDVPGKYVGRGGEKLEAALVHFNITVSGLVVLDVGASTGGFTDCLLVKGAKCVYAVDVGHGQLHHKLRSDPRVVCLERTHAKDLLPEMFKESPEVATVDVSFISVRKILPQVFSAMAEKKQLLVLVKPQFELGREYVEKGGVIKKRENQEEAIKLVTAFGESELGLEYQGSFPSPLKGEKKGNQEYFVLFTKNR